MKNPFQFRVNPQKDLALYNYLAEKALNYDGFSTWIRAVLREEMRREKAGINDGQQMVSITPELCPHPLVENAADEQMVDDSDEMVRLQKLVQSF